MTYTIASDGTEIGSSVPCQIFTYSFGTTGEITADQDAFDVALHEGFYTFELKSKMNVGDGSGDSDLTTFSLTRILKADCNTADTTLGVDSLSSFVSSSPHSVTIMAEATFDFTGTFTYALQSCRP